MAPLLDVVLLLLIFFVVTTSFTDEQLDITLAEAQTGEASAEDVLIVSVDVDGRLSIGKERVSLARIRESFDLARIDRRAVEIRADDQTRHGQVVELLDLARQTGVPQLGITVGQRGGSEMPALTDEPRKEGVGGR